MMMIFTDLLSHLQKISICYSISCTFNCCDCHPLSLHEVVFMHFKKQAPEYIILYSLPFKVFIHFSFFCSNIQQFCCYFKELPAVELRNGKTAGRRTYHTRSQGDNNV